ncbi:MAG: universal stress protein [Candidatus Omnitrophica bacterium]|nr:universal stress protein [Candidatus Omnitrophota bacterium]
MTTTAIEKILVPLGGSDYNVPTLKVACGLARDFTAELVGLHVEDIRISEGPAVIKDPMTISMNPFYQGDSKEIEKRLKERSAAVRKYFKECAGVFGAKETFLAKRGLVAQEILNVAEDCDIVVMGKRGEHGQWIRPWLGSSAVRVIHSLKKTLVLVGKNVSPDWKNCLLVSVDGDFGQGALHFAKTLATQGNVKLHLVNLLVDSGESAKVQSTIQDILGVGEIPTTHVSAKKDAVDAVKQAVAEAQAEVVLMESMGIKGKSVVARRLESDLLDQMAASVILIRE